MENDKSQKGYTFNYTGLFKLEQNQFVYVKCLKGPAIPKHRTSSKYSNTFCNNLQSKYSKQTNICKKKNTFS